MPTQDELTTLTSLLAELTPAIETITTHLKSKNLPEPNLVSGFLPRDTEIFAARDTVRRVAGSLAILSEYASYEFIMNKAVAAPYCFSPIHVAVKYGVPKAIGEDEEVGIVELAKRVGCEDVSRLADVMRVSVQQFFFRQTGPDVFAHNKFSLSLRKEEESNVVPFTIDYLTKGSAHFYDQISRFPHSRDPKQSSFAIGNGTVDKASFYEVLASPEGAALAKQMADTMVSVTPFSFEVLGKVYPWESLAGKTIVDVGGSLGHCSAFLASIVPTAKFIIQDLPHIITEATTTPIPGAQAVGLEFEAHDFFTPQPRAADAYFLRWILHNHPNHKCAEIIKCLLPQLKPGKNGSGGKILIADTVIERDARPPLGYENQMMNIMMAALHNAQERTFQEFKELFESVDKRFRLRQYGSNGPMASELVEAWLEEDE